MAKQKRNTNGMGSVRQRADGRWEARYTGTDGKQHSVYGKTATKCAEKLRAQLAAIDQRAWCSPDTITVGEWMRTWLDDCDGRVEHTTLSAYRSTYRCTIAPTIGGIRLQALTARDIEHMTRVMRKRGNRESTIRERLSVLSRALNAAVRAHLIPQNLMEEIRRPSTRRKPMTIVDRQQIPAFVAEARQMRHGNALQFALLTGLRSGEIRGLRWQDIDAATGELHVRMQYDGSTHELRPPKDDSVRDIHLPDAAMQVLARQRAAQAADRLRLGAAWPRDGIADGLVFRGSTGKPISDSTYCIAAHTIGQKIGLPDLTFHDLRHSYAVAALRSGADVKTVQHNLGHSTSAMTLDVYAAYTTDAAQQAAARLDTYILGSN